MRRGGHGVPLQAMADAAEQAGRPSAHRWQGVEADAGWRASSVTGGAALRTIAALRALVAEYREQVISLLDITRVVHANHYGSPGFEQEAFVRNLRAEQALALKEADMLERIGVK